MRRKLLFPLLLLTTLAVPASLNAQATYSEHRPVPNLELYGGYSYVFRTYNPNSTSYAVSGRNGWDASLKVPILGSFLGIKGDVTGTYLNGEPHFNPKAYFFLLGPQVSFHLGKSTLFAHGMVGSAHVTENALPNLRSDNTFAVAVGAGLDVGISRNLAWRFTGDFYNTHYKATDRNVSEVLNSNGRVSTGPVLRF